MKLNRPSLSNNEDEKNLPGDPKIGMWLIIGTIFGVFFVTLYLITGLIRFLEGAILPIIIGPLEWLVSNRFNSKNYSELPIDHPIYKAVNWDQFDGNVHIYSSNQISNRIPLIHVDKSNIFLRSDIFERLNIPSIEWLIKFCHIISKKNKLREIIFALTLIFLIFFLYLLFTWFGQKSLAVLLLIFATSIPIALILGGKIFELFLKKSFLTITMSPAEISAASEAIQTLQGYRYLWRYRFSRHLFLTAGNRNLQKWLTEAKTKALERKSD